MIFGFCNPLLDITANVSDEFLEKYELVANNAILAEEKHMPLFQELIENHKVNYTAGGAGQNTIRAAQWLLPSHSTVFVGCVGRDERASQLRQIAEGDGLQVEYMETEAAQTGMCACLITKNGTCRSLVASLGAANCYTQDHFLSGHMQTVFESATIIYISGFFLTVSPQTALEAARRGKEQGKIVCMNLSAPFICEYFTTQLLSIFPHLDFLFGNESEALAINKALQLGCSEVKDIATAIQNATPQSPRNVIFTQGAQCTWMTFGESIVSLNVPSVAAEEIVDTNGAGDAFVGGFLAKLYSAIKNGNVIDQQAIMAAINVGHDCAQVIIKRSGVTFPPHPISIN